MIRKIKKTLRHSYLFYNIYLRFVSYWRLFIWEIRNRPIPSTHIIKQRCIRDFQQRFGIDCLIETGTYNGSMIIATLPYFKEIYSIELDDKLYQSANILFSSFNHVHLYHGDSAEVLGRLIPEIHQPCIFWLDAHYSGEGTAISDVETPIENELNHILSWRKDDYIILIDDARCFIGNSDYPSLKKLEEIVLNRHPRWTFDVKDDIIRIFNPYRTLSSETK